MTRLFPFFLAWVASCNQPRVDTRHFPAHAFRISDASQLVPGPAATGTVGDFRMQNGLVAVVISDHAAAMGFSESGGNLVDAATVHGQDTLGQMFLYLGTTFPRQANYDSVKVGESRGRFATVVATGRDSHDANIELVTEYRLETGKNYVTITTFVIPRKHALTEYPVGDVLQWGGNVHFVPRAGFLAKGRHSAVPWIGAVGESSSYGYAAQADFSVLNGSAWTDTVVATLNVAVSVDGSRANGASFTRTLVIGDAPDLASVLPSLAEVRGEKLARISGRVLGPRKLPVADARVLAEDTDGRLLATATSDRRGRFVLPLTEGPVVLFAESSARGKSAGQTAHAPMSGVRLHLSEPATLDVHIYERTPQGSQLSPGKVTVLGRAGTANPNFGPRHSAQGAFNVRTTADGELAFKLPAGSYSVIVSRGPEFDVSRLEIALAPGESRTLTLVLLRVVDTRGYLSADFHQHSFYSGDSGVMPRDRIVSNLAEGVELAVATEHNEVVDLSAIVKALGAHEHIKVIPGLEATTQTLGHINAYPVSPTSGPRHGAPVVDNMSAHQVISTLREQFPDAVVQVNHPRASRDGYFVALGFDRSQETQPPTLSLSFDALEILNGKRPGDLDAVMLDWFWLLSHGHVVTATGGSDSHAIVGEEAGYPRTYFAVNDDRPDKLSPDELARAIKITRDVVISNGPFINLQRDNKSAIGKPFAVRRGEPITFDLTVQAAAWVDVTHIEIVHGQTGSNQAPTVRRIAVRTPREQVVRYHDSISLRIQADSWLIVVVRGEQSLYPVVQGREAPPTPVAVTNPVWLSVTHQ